MHIYKVSDSLFSFLKNTCYSLAYEWHPAGDGRWKCLCTHFKVAVFYILFTFFFFFNTCKSWHVEPDVCLCPSHTCAQTRTHGAPGLSLGFKTCHCFGQQDVEPALLLLFSPSEQQAGAVLQLYLNSNFDWSNPSHSHFQRANPSPPPHPPKPQLRSNFPSHYRPSLINSWSWSHSFPNWLLNMLPQVFYSAVNGQKRRSKEGKPQREQRS